MAKKEPPAGRSEPSTPIAIVLSKVKALRESAEALVERKNPQQLAGPIEWVWKSLEHPAYSDRRFSEAYDAFQEEQRTMNGVADDLRHRGYKDPDFRFNPAGRELRHATGIRTLYEVLCNARGRLAFPGGVAVFAHDLRWLEQALERARSAVSPDDNDPARMMLLTKAQGVFGFKSAKELTCFLDHHPEVGQGRPRKKDGTPHKRKRLVDALALSRAISRDDAIMSDPVRRSRMQSRLQRAQLSKELEASAIAFITGGAE